MKAESFGYKNAWIAFKGVRPDAVAEALSLRNVGRATGQAGLKAASEYPITCSVFVTPPIDGWVLCVGFPMFTPVDARPPVFGLLSVEWAARLQTEVQYWPGAGSPGETVLDQGPPTAEEQALGLAT